MLKLKNYHSVMMLYILGAVIILFLLANIVVSLNNLRKDSDGTRMVFGFLANAVAVPCLLWLAFVGASVVDFL